MKQSEIVIGQRTIGCGHQPFVIAEMSGNHNQSLDRALEIVDKAKECGCDALKIQTYTADTITMDCKRKEFLIDDKQNLWSGAYLYDLYKKAYTPWEWHQPIFDRCRERGLVAFSTPFDETAVDFLEELNVPAYKIASFENNHIPLLEKVAKTGKPVLMSTGMASTEELEEAVRTLKDHGCVQIVLLKCTSAYPSLFEEANLMTIPDLAERFDCLAGLSDHTPGVGVAVAAVALGATVVEKHFTLSRDEGGVDAAFSLEPAEMAVLVEECARAQDALGKVHYGTTHTEKKSLRFRRSIFAAEDITKGEKLTLQNIRVIRPGQGLAPRHYRDLLGKTAAKAVERGTPMDWDMIQ